MELLSALMVSDTSIWIAELSSMKRHLEQIDTANNTLETNFQKKCCVSKTGPMVSKLFFVNIWLLILNFFNLKLQVNYDPRSYECNLRIYV